MWAAHASLTSQWLYGYYRLVAQCQNVPEFAGFGHSQRSQHSLLFVDCRHRVMAGSTLPLRVFLPLLRYCDALPRVPRWNTSEVSFKSLHPEKAKVLSGPLLVSILKHPTHVLSFPVTHFSTLDPRTKAYLSLFFLASKSGMLFWPCCLVPVAHLSSFPSISALWVSSTTCSLPAISCISVPGLLAYWRASCPPDHPRLIFCFQHSQPLVIQYS